MTLELVIGIAALIVMAFFLLQWFQKPKEGTRQLAMTIWAAFGPYDTAKYAEESLYRACRAVFGKEGLSAHENWIQGHIKNFKEWEAKGDFLRAQKIQRTGLMLTAYGKAFKAACNAVKAEAIEDFDVEGFNKEFLKDSGYRFEVVKQADGTDQLAYKKIWSDEDILKKKQELGEAILNQVGNNLLQDESPESKALLAFLSNVYKANMDRDIETSKDIGVIWFTCIELLNKDPDSEITKAFDILNDAWANTRPNDDEMEFLQNANSDISWSDNPGCFERHLQRKCENPLFTLDKLNVTQREVDLARQKDEQDAVELQEELEKLLRTVGALPDKCDWKQTSDIREKIDTLLDRAAEVGGELGDSVSITLHELRKVLVDSQKKALADNEEALDALRKAEQYHQSGASLFNNAFVAQMQREDTPITREEIIPALLSESPDTIRKVMKILNDDVRNVIRQGCVQLLYEAKASGTIIPQLDEKLNVLGSK